MSTLIGRHLRRTMRFASRAAVLGCVSFSAAPALSQIGPPSNLNALLEDVFKPGVYNVPVVQARTENTEIGIEYAESGSTVAKTVRTVSALVSRSATRKDMRVTTVVNSAKRKLSGSLSANLPDFKKTFQLKSDASIELDSTREQTESLAVEESSEDKRKLDSLAEITDSKNIAFGPDAGFFRSTVVLSNLTNAAGYIEDLTVTLRWKDPTTQQGGAIETKKLCDAIGQAHVSTAVAPRGSASSGTVVAAPSTTMSATEPAPCRFRIAAHDPAQPEIRIPVRFTGFNTGEIKTWMGRKVWLEVHPLVISVGDNKVDAANIDNQLAARSVILKLIQPDGRATVRYVTWRPGITAEAALRTAFGEDRVETGGVPKRVTRIASLRADADDWGDPKLYKMSELDQGAWVLASPTPNTAIDTAVDPGTSFLVAFLSKRDILWSQSSAEKFKLNWSTDFRERAHFQASASCEDEGHLPAAFRSLHKTPSPQKQVLPGDEIHLKFLVQRVNLGTRETDFTQLPIATTAAQAFGSPLEYRNFYEAARAKEIVATPIGEWRPVREWNLAAHGIDLRFGRNAPSIDLQTVAAATGASVEHALDGTVTVRFTVDKGLIPSGMGEVCLVHRLAMVNLETGRTAPPRASGGRRVVTPGRRPRDPLPDWLKEFPLEMRAHIQPGQWSADLTLIRIGRAVDDPYVLAAKAEATPGERNPEAVRR